MPSWPVSLPAYVLEAGYSETLEDQTLETSMDTGPVKVRRRFTTGIRPFRFTIQMTAAQAATFETFYLTTLQGGSLSFDWVHPRTRVAKVFRFRKPPPQITSRGETVFVSCAVETIP